MCLAIPARVVELPPEGACGEGAIVEVGGVRKAVSLALLDDVAPGDYVLVHVGYALSRIDANEAAQTLALLAAIASIEDAS